MRFSRVSLSLLFLLSPALLGDVLPTPPSAATTPAIPVPSIHRSLARITTTSQDPNYREPWASGQISEAVGTGLIIDGERILTNAHVVSNARFLTVEKEDDPHKYTAKVQFIGHDCDLAVLKINEPGFFKNTVPLELGGIPEIESTVAAYGYPVGGDRLSVTEGIVSRIDFQTYTHSGVDSHLAIQISAAINPGNSGGPVMQHGKVVGVAFQGYSGDVAQNVGYMIPVPVIERFLKDISDGHYDGYMDLSVTTFPLQNPAMRHALGLADDDRGVMVSNVAAEGCSDGVLKEGDVLMSIDGHDIASDGFIMLDGARVQMAEVVERKFKGDSVNLHIIRDHKEMNVTVKLEASWPYLMQANTYDAAPRYVVYGGLLFQPLSRNFLEAYDIDDLQVRYFYDFFLEDELYKEHPEVIVLSAILPDPINTYLTDFRDGIVDEINGVKVRTLDDLANGFRAPADQYVIKLIGMGRPLVIDRAAAEAARQRIDQRYNVVKEENLRD
ncbi:MAG TPA: trypsin-like peptidase domain-containing protein [Chthoniobacteraceae bacterium]|jgi:S1-C subfamily serine protease|nr:trypsin-like peptidase domain-containing protein [Chthoniobacteraceae bacterium]